MEIVIIKLLLSHDNLHLFTELKQFTSNFFPCKLNMEILFLKQKLIEKIIKPEFVRTLLV